MHHDRFGQRFLSMPFLAVCRFIFRSNQSPVLFCPRSRSDAHHVTSQHVAPSNHHKGRCEPPIEDRNQEHLGCKRLTFHRCKYSWENRLTKSRYSSGCSGNKHALGIIEVCEFMCSRPPLAVSVWRTVV